MKTRYDWKSVLLFRVHWRNLYDAMRQSNPGVGRLRALWWTLLFPHVHIGDEDDE